MNGWEEVGEYMGEILRLIMQSLIKTVMVTLEGSEGGSIPKSSKRERWLKSIMTCAHPLKD